MVNPFERRATEYLRDDESFLPVVTAAPLAHLFKRHAENGGLFDRLVLVIGTPGSGKTTHARLFQYTTLTTLLRNEGLQNQRSLIDTMSQCGAILDGAPIILGARIPLESEYRDFWEFPYPDDVKFHLMTALLQARTLLLWMRNLQSAGHKLTDIAIIPRSDASAALEAIGGGSATELMERARDVERAIYRISAALLPPALNDLGGVATAAYHPFDVIEAFQVGTGDAALQLRPLVIFDDAHTLHSEQFTAMKKWLLRREIRVGRWVQTRLDALKPVDVLRASNEASGEKPSRELIEIWMQTPADRREERKAFRKTARDMTNRYLSQMDMFSRRQILHLGDILATEEPTIPKSKLAELEKKVDAAQDAASVTPARRKAIEGEVTRYLDAAKAVVGPEVQLAMTSILMHRYAKRTPQMGLFEGEQEDFEPSKPLVADSEILDGAKVHLMHLYDRPYYFGFDMLCDSASENAEQLLQLSAILVDQAETNCIRRKPATLTARDQHRLLRRRAEAMIKEWDYPFVPEVRRLCDGLAAQCIEKSLEPNASLGGGATAFGVPQEEFEQIPKADPRLARILQFGSAYNAFTLVPNKSVKNRLWCLIDLGGPYRLKSGLTLRYGNFVERSVDDVKSLLEGGGA